MIVCKSFMEDNNKRIVKNTIFLYVRMLVIMALGFFTTRVVLEKLGVSDYGIYNVIGGFVALFTLLNNILQSATRRFMSISIGRGIKEEMNETFSTSFVMHLVIGLLVVLLLETIGIWMVNSQLNIEPERMPAANWVYHISVFSVFLSITQTPFTSAVTAHERFGIYAYMSIFDVVGKLAILYLLVVIDGDKLVIYALLLAIVNMMSLMIYRVYCVRSFEECEFSLKVNKTLFKEMIAFSGWDSLGNISAIINVHGVTILLNIFLGTTINAARGVANTVNSTISQFVSGFITAAEPQLAKYYAVNDMVRFEKLIFNISQFTLFMLSIIAVPVLMEMEYVLQLWLDTVPDYTSVFIKITVLACFIQYSNYMVAKGIVAIGKVKLVTLFTVPFYYLLLPLVYLVLQLEFSPIAVYIVGVIPSIAGFIMNLRILSKYTPFHAKQYFIQVFAKSVLLICLASIPPYLLRMVMEEGGVRFFSVCTLSVLTTALVVYQFGLNKATKEMVLAKVHSLPFLRFLQK